MKLPAEQQQLKPKTLSKSLPKSIRARILKNLDKDGVVILSPSDALDVLPLLEREGFSEATIMLDPWYNKGVGGVRDDYKVYIESVLLPASKISNHIYLWGFPEIVANFINSVPDFQINAWLTWYYKNSPSVIRGWRSSQQACIHFCQPGAKLYPQHFLTDEQNEKLKAGKMRFIPGPPSVIEESLLVGFVGKKENTPHPAQKPLAVYDKLIRMTTVEGDLVIDPMAGSGTTGEVARRLNRKAILSDISEEYTQIMENRLGIKRTSLL